jgi:histidyl-tRNA synthetase
VDIFVVVDGAPRVGVVRLIGELRAQGLSCDIDYAARSVKGQLTQAQRSGARTVVVARAKAAEVRVRGESAVVVALDELAATLGR